MYMTPDLEDICDHADDDEKDVEDDEQDTHSIIYRETAEYYDWQSQEREIAGKQRNRSRWSQRSWRRSDNHGTWNLQLDHQADFHDSQFMEQSLVQGSTRKGTRQNQKITDHSVLPNALQHFLHYDIQQTICQTRQLPIPWRGRIQKAIPDDRSSSDVQAYCSEKQRTEHWLVGGGDRLQEGIQFKRTWCNL